MNAVNSVQLFILFWAFIAVCQAGGVDLCSVSCEDVTGTVGEEVTFTCSVPQKCTKCCIVMNKFKYEDSEICRQEFPLDSCEQRNSFTCRYTPTTAMKGQSSFFVQRKCGSLNTEFTVNITEPQKRVIEDYEPRNPETVSKDYDEKVVFPKDSSNLYKSEETSKEKKAEGRGFKVAVIAAVVSGFIIVIVPIIHKMKQNFKQKKDNCQESGLISLTQI